MAYYSFMYMVDPVLSGHPMGNGGWQLNTGWPANDLCNICA